MSAVDSPNRISAYDAARPGARSGLDKAMLRISREIILVADSSKFSRRGMLRIASFSEVDTVISDSGLSEEMQEKLRSFGCNVILA